MPAVPDGLPDGVQLIRARFREDFLVDAAQAVEDRAPVHTLIQPQWKFGARGRAARGSRPDLLQRCSARWERAEECVPGEGERDLELRIGISSGPVVAGVIGRRRFLYDLWSDTVHRASRMESYGTPDTIQLTRSTWELVREDFVAEPRGPVPVKGKGEVETWYLLGPRG